MINFFCFFILKKLFCYYMNEILHLVILKKKENKLRQQIETILINKKLDYLLVVKSIEDLNTDLEKNIFYVTKGNIFLKGISNKKNQSYNYIYILSTDDILEQKNGTSNYAEYDFYADDVTTNNENILLPKNSFVISRNSLSVLLKNKKKISDNIIEDVSNILLENGILLNHKSVLKINKNDYKFIDEDFFKEEYFNENDITNNYVDLTVQQNFSFIIQVKKKNFLLANLKKIFEKIGIVWKITFEITQEDFDNNINNPHEYYILLAPENLTIFPPKDKYIICPMKNVNYSDEILNKFGEGISIWDHSMKSISNKEKYHFLPLPINNNFYRNDGYIPNNTNKILVICNENERTTKIIDYLKQYFIIENVNRIASGIKIESNIIVYLNESGYFREDIISQLIARNMTIIYESFDDKDIYNYLIYRKRINFVERIDNNISNIITLHRTLNNIISGQIPMMTFEENQKFIFKINKRFEHFLISSLVTLNLLDKDYLRNTLFDDFKGIYFIESENKENLYITNLLGKETHKNNAINMNYFGDQIVDKFKEQTGLNFDNNIGKLIISNIKSCNFLKYISGDFFIVTTTNININVFSLLNDGLYDFLKGCPNFDVFIIDKIYTRSSDESYERWHYYYTKKVEEIFLNSSCFILSKNGADKISQACTVYDYENFDYNQNNKKYFLTLMFSI